MSQACVTRWISCPECEASCRDHALPPGTELHCQRCGVRVKKASGLRSLQPAWAFATAGLFFAVLANGNPILTFDVAGNTQSNLIVTGVFSLFQQGYGPVAALVFFAGLAGPVLGMGTFQMALATVPSGIVLPITATTPLMVIPFAYWLEGERPSKRSLVGGVIAVAGAVALTLQ